ncbi:MAG: hypothetical protein HY537_16740 [Deltaproteobacteria bacterium]|nr:hypothetical protein [Deltaproteobacteria bacterium]
MFRQGWYFGFVGLVSLSISGFNAEAGTKQAVVQRVTGTDGEIRPALIVIEKENGIPSSRIRGFYPSELIDFVKANPDLKGLVSKVVEVPESQLIDTLNAFPANETVYLYLANVGKLASLAGQINARDPGFSGRGANTTPSPFRSLMQPPPKRSGSGNGEIDKLIALMKPEDQGHIDKTRLAKLLKRRATDAPKGEEGQVLYNALALLLSDDRCDFETVKTTQRALLDGIDFYHKPIDIDYSTDFRTGIGDMTIERKRSANGQQPEPITLTWGGYHPWKAWGVQDWLGQFYIQLKSKGLCSFEHTQTQEPDGRMSTPVRQQTHSGSP